MSSNMASRLTYPSRLRKSLLNFTQLKELCERQFSLSHASAQYKSLLRFHREQHSRSRVSLCKCKILSCQSLLRPFSSEAPVIESRKKPVPPHKVVERELADITGDIKQIIEASSTELKDLAHYYFDGKGKLFRPMVVMLLAKALNFHQTANDSLLSSQQQIAMISEMIHTASLMHDDVIDHADTRRGKPSINNVWGQRKSIIAGDFVMAMASISLARIRNEEVVAIVSQITEDLVKGEFMQLGSKENENERFAHYLNKTFKKTASLLANSCKAVAVLGGCDEDLSEMAYSYGKNLGISFQLIDDVLDFTSCDHVMGKPTAADLKLGLATAPVLFAAQEFPELHAMIMRRFSEEGDVEMARMLVAKSDGVRETRILAEEHSNEAIQLIRTLNNSTSRIALEMLARKVLNREK